MARTKYVKQAKCIKRSRPSKQPLRRKYSLRSQKSIGNENNTDSNRFIHAMQYKNTAHAFHKGGFEKLAVTLAKAWSIRGDLKMSKDAVDALQEAAEDHLVKLFKAATLCARHAKRVTVMPKDISIAEMMI